MSQFTTAFPNSTKIYVDGPQRVRLPMREVALSGGDRPARVYDTSGPQDHDVVTGLPELREPWVRCRSGSVTQLHHARDGAVTPDVDLLAVRQGLPARFVR